MTNALDVMTAQHYEAFGHGPGSILAKPLPSSFKKNLNLMWPESGIRLQHRIPVFPNTKETRLTLSFCTGNPEGSIVR
jgi:hypothetical protein